MQNACACTIDSDVSVLAVHSGYLSLVVVGLEKLYALNASLFTSIKTVLENIDRLCYDHCFR